MLNEDLRMRQSRNVEFGKRNLVRPLSCVYVPATSLTQTRLAGTLVRDPRSTIRIRTEKECAGKN